MFGELDHNAFNNATRQHTIYGENGDNSGISLHVVGLIHAESRQGAWNRPAGSMDTSHSLSPPWASSGADSWTTYIENSVAPLLAMPAPATASLPVLL